MPFNAKLKISQITVQTSRVRIPPCKEKKETATMWYNKSGRIFDTKWQIRM
jgi:hypothetical protein